MKIPDHIEIITEQIEAMRKDKHDRNGPVSILLDSLEYGANAILEAAHKKPEPFSPKD